MKITSQINKPFFFFKEN